MKQYRTSNDNFTIDQPDTQAEKLAFDQQIIPQQNIEGIEFYSPRRNLHTYPIFLKEKPQ